jgi:hypothetical protein
VLQHRGALDVDELVVAPGVAVDFQVCAFGNPLGVLDSLLRVPVVDSAVRIDELGLFRIGDMLADQVVAQAREHYRRAGITLAASATAQLVIKSVGVIAAGAHDA